MNMKDNSDFVQDKNRKHRLLNSGKWYLRRDAASGNIEQARYYRTHSGDASKFPFAGNYLDTAMQFKSEEEAEQYRLKYKFEGYEYFYPSMK